MFALDPDQSVLPVFLGDQDRFDSGQVGVPPASKRQSCNTGAELRLRFFHHLGEINPLSKELFLGCRCSVNFS